MVFIPFQMKNFFRLISPGIFFIACLLLSQIAEATHIRAGEIIARRLDSQSLTYEIILRGYADRESAVIIGSNGTLDFGDGTSAMIQNTGDPDDPSYIQRTAISEDTWMYELKINHTYAAASSYTISFREFYRNEGILNMDNSANMPFYVETLIVIDPYLGMNSSVELQRPPIDHAFVGKTYHHQPGAFDADGDSLSYRMIVSRQDKDLAVEHYRFPHQTFPTGDSRNGLNETGSAPVFRINPISGDIIWDAPGAAGEYNVSFQVVEWRKVRGAYYQMGYVTRDMQIIVEDSGAGQPQLVYPFASGQVNPAAGELHSWTITATAPSAEDSVVLEIWGDFLLRTNATINNRVVRAKGEASITIQWTGEENTGQHYQLIARAYDPSTPQYTRNRSTYFYYNQAEPLGIQELSSAEIKIYPNPVSNHQLTINLATPTLKASFLQLYDIKGRLVLQQTVPLAKQDVTVLLPQEGKGTYLLLLHHNGQIYRHKLIVQ